MQTIEKDTYVVMRVYNTASLSSILFTTPDSQDAQSYASIMKRAEPEYEYAVAKVIAKTITKTKE